MVGAAVRARAVGVGVFPFFADGDLLILGVVLMAAGLVIRVALDVWMRFCPVARFCSAERGVTTIVSVMTAAVLGSTVLVASGVVLIALGAVH